MRSAVNPINHRKSKRPHDHSQQSESRFENPGPYHGDCNVCGKGRGEDDCSVHRASLDLLVQLGCEIECYAHLYDYGKKPQNQGILGNQPEYRIAEHIPVVLKTKECFSWRYHIPLEKTQISAIKNRPKDENCQKNERWCGKANEGPHIPLLPDRHPLHTILLVQTSHKPPPYILSIFVVMEIHLRL